MSKIKMKLLDIPAGDLFDRQVASYTQYMSRDVLRFPDLIEKIKKNGEDTQYFERYSVYMKWGIRKLEYAFVLDNLLLNDGLKLLDVGSGITILPHILSRMGCEVHALDPASHWKLANSEIGQFYNSFYSSDVKYINDHVHSIQGRELYDRVISVSVLEHLPKKEIGRTLDKILALLKPGGHLVLTMDYCPRSADFRFEVINKIMRRLNRLGLGIEVSKGGISFSAFKRLVYNHLPGLDDLSDLKRQDQIATSYQRFWSSHAFQGCLYQKYRPYLALGICCVKPMRRGD